MGVEGWRGGGAGGFLNRNLFAPSECLKFIRRETIQLT